MPYVIYYIVPSFFLYFCSCSNVDGLVSLTVYHIEGGTEIIYRAPFMSVNFGGVPQGDRKSTTEGGVETCAYVYVGVFPIFVNIS